MKKWIILLFASLLGLSWYGAVSEIISKPEKLNEHLEKAEELEEKGILVDAITEYEDALQYDPNNVDISLKMANAYLKNGDKTNFEAVCQRTAKDNQDDTKALNTLIDYYLENDAESKALDFLRDFTETYPDNENAEKRFLEIKGSYIELYCQYDKFGEMVNDFMVVEQAGAYGVVNAVGQEIIPGFYKEIHPFSKDGFALALREDGSYIYIDEKEQTRMVPDKEYADLGMINEERVVASKGGTFGYLDRNMEPATEFQFEALTGVQKGVGAAKKNGKWALIDKDGKERTEFAYDDVIVDENGFCSWQDRIFVKENGHYHLVNRKGKTIGETTFDNARAFTENGFAAVCKNGKWGFVNTDGDIVLDYSFEEAKSFQNGFAAVSRDGKWGYIDEQGNLLIEPVFLEVSAVSSEGTMAVKRVNDDKEEEWQLIQMDLFL